jgi:CHAT domain-containing protein
LHSQWERHQLATPRPTISQHTTRQGFSLVRALLVSHWAVNSDATVKLIIKAFDEIKADPKIRGAEALRRSMLVLIASYDRNAHPANWAPFVVVGEGAR